MRRRTGRGRRIGDVVIAALFVLSVAGIAAFVEKWAGRSVEGPARIVDGDTLIVLGERVRLRGIDAPELGQKCAAGDGTSHPCGRLAARHLEALVGGGRVDCTGHDTDRYGRFLGVCRTGDDGLSLNAAMVESGWAVAYGDHGRLERQARAGRRGIWAWQFEQPAQWRRKRAALEDEAVPRAGPGVAIRRLLGWIGRGGHDE